MAKKNNYASTTHATGYNSENDAIATALAGAAAMKEHNPSGYKNHNCSWSNEIN